MNWKIMLGIAVAGIVAYHLQSNATPDANPATRRLAMSPQHIALIEEYYKATPMKPKDWAVGVEGQGADAQVNFIQLLGSVEDAKVNLRLLCPPDAERLWSNLNENNKIYLAMTNLQGERLYSHPGGCKGPRRNVSE